MEWTTECEKAPAICPEGTYRARLTEIRDVQTSTGTAVRLMFVVYLDDGSEIDQVSALASTSLHEKSRLFRWLGVLGGRMIEVGERVRASQFIGKECRVEVKHKNSNDKTFANVTEVLALSQEEGEVPF
jgi:hypothetical protein